MSGLSNNKKINIALIALAAFIGVANWTLLSDNDESPQSFIRISGIKPNDATIKAWANYWVKGDECESYSYDMFGRKAFRGGKSTERFTRNYADDPNNYEIKIPYQTHTDSQSCIVELRDITVEAYNAFDTVGFAQLRIAQTGTGYNNKAIDLNSQIKARDCDSFIHQWKDQTWSGGLGCHFYFNENKISKESETNAESVYFDFSQFNDETVIHYDILAGEDYRSAPLDPQTGK